MPLTYKQAKEQLFGPDYMPIPGTADHLKIRQLMAKSAEKQRHTEPVVVVKELPATNPINKPAPAQAKPNIPTKNEVFATQEFQKHYIKYLDSISVGNTRQRNVENQKTNTTISVESNAKATNE